MSKDANSTTDENSDVFQRAAASLDEISDAPTSGTSPPASIHGRTGNAADCAKSFASVSPLLMDEGQVQSPAQQRVVKVLEGGGVSDVDVKASSSRFGLSVPMFYYCFIGAVCGSLPRAITLAISNAFPSVGIVEGMNFKELWAPCHENKYPGASPDGLFHRYIILSDHFWTYLSITLCYVSGMRSSFFLQNTRATRYEN